MKRVRNNETRTHSLTAASPLSRTWSIMGLTCKVKCERLKTTVRKRESVKGRRGKQTRENTEEKSIRGRAIRLRRSASPSSDNLYDFMITHSTRTKTKPFSSPYSLLPSLIQTSLFPSSAREFQPLKKSHFRT